jgi:hypothetical protein
VHIGVEQVGGKSAHCELTARSATDGILSKSAEGMGVAYAKRGTVDEAPLALCSKRRRSMKPASAQRVTSIPVRAIMGALACRVRLDALSKTSAQNSSDL